MRDSSLLNSLRNRELGLSNTPLPHHFTKLESDRVVTMGTRDWLSLTLHPVQEEELVPIYSLATLGPGLLASDETGQLHHLTNWFTKPSPSTTVHSTRLAQNSAIYTVKELGGKLGAGIGNGHLTLIDLHTFQHIRTYTSHEKSIKKVDSFDGEILATGSRDNTINVHDLRVKSLNPVNIIHNAHSISSSETGASWSRCKSALTRASPSSSVTDLLFLDQHNLISSGAADGLIKQWDLRVTYKHMKKFHPVQVIEYPINSNTKGYGCLQLSNSKLFASSVQHEIFQFDRGTMAYEATYLSPSKLSYYTKLDVSKDGRMLASGSEEQKVNIFKTLQIPCTETIQPIHTLATDDHLDLPVCCVLFSPFDDLMVTTGGDSSIVRKWLPGMYLDSLKEVRVGKEEEAQVPALKTEFRYLRRWSGRAESPKSPAITCQVKVNVERSLRLDCFPNFVMDGIRLPHVNPRIKIKLRTIAPTNWLQSPETTKSKRRIVEETTPKSRSVRKRKKFSDDSPKILDFFKVSTTPTSTFSLEH